MAPVAGFLAAGGLPEELGPLQAVSALVRSEDAPARREVDGSVIGRVVSVDRFGNVVTDIGHDLLTSFRGDDLNSFLTIEVGTRRHIPWVPSYSARPRGELLATIGSRGTLEIAVNTGHAAERLGIGPGTPVRVCR
jgi:S-adenosylmethionine hydrolase